MAIFNTASYVKTYISALWMLHEYVMLPAGADKALLTEKTTSKEQLEAAAESSGGLLLRDFKAMHAAIMQKAQTGNRRAFPGLLDQALPGILNHVLAAC